MAFFVLADSTVKIIAKSLEPLAQTYSRLFLAGVITVILFHKKIRSKAIFKATKHTLKWIFITGGLGFGIKAILFTLGLIHTKLLNVSSIDSLTPLVVYLYSIVLFKTKFDLRTLGFIAISIYGALMIATKSFIPIISQYGIGELFISASIFMTALSIVGRKILGTTLNNFEVAASTYLIASLLLFLLTTIVGERSIFDGLTTEAFVLLLFSSVLSAFAAVLVNYALTKLEATLISQILLSKIIFSLLLGFILLRELPLRIEVIGSGIIIVGVYLANRYRFLIKEKVR
ncbi:DMT family transporter [Candidatus Roizmanbacteria bacterium]|nr:DMT family transporter [Candidatus Roizmanbacteria bacterium]